MSSAQYLETGTSKNTKFGTNLSNKILLNAAKYQGYRFYLFWVSKGKPKGWLKLPLIHIRVKTILIPSYIPFLTFCSRILLFCCITTRIFGLISYIIWNFQPYYLQMNSKVSLLYCFVLYIYLFLFSCIIVSLWNMIIIIIEKKMYTGLLSVNISWLLRIVTKSLSNILCNI